MEAKERPRPNPGRPSSEDIHIIPILHPKNMQTPGMDAEVITAIHVGQQ
jgi:hypothetical protein